MATPTQADPNTLLQVIERIEMKLVMANTDQQLEKLLAEYLPRLLSLLLFPNDEVRNKIVSVLSHINKRVKQQNQKTAVKLPVEPVLALYLQRSDHPMQNFVRNFAIIYVEMGFQRCDPQEKRQLFPVLFEQLATLLDADESGNATDTTQMTPQQRLSFQQQMDAVLRLILDTLPHLQFPRTRSETARTPDDENQDGGDTAARSPTSNVSLELELQERFGFIEEHMEYGKSAARVVLLDFLLDLLLLRSNFSLSSSSIDIPAGLSINAVKRILDKRSRIDGKELEQKKLSSLELLIQSNQFREIEIIPHLIVGACEGSDTVVAKCEATLKKLQMMDYEDDHLLNKLARLYLGDNRERRSPVAEHIKLRILSVLSKSVAAASFFPQIKDILMDCVFSEFETRRLRAAGMTLFSWVINMGKETILEQHVGEFFDRLFNFVSQISSLSSSSSSRHVTLSSSTSSVSDMKEDFYIALGMLSSKFPSFVRDKPHIVKTYFDALEREQPQVRISIQQGLGSLISAFMEPNAELTSMFENLFMSIYEKGQAGHNALFSALQMSNTLFRFQHLPSRLLNLLCVNDEALQIREEALRGSELDKFMRYRGFGEAATREEEKLNHYPEFSDMTAHVYHHMKKRHAQQARNAPPGIAVTPSFPTPKVLEHILLFLESCFSKSAQSKYITERTFAKEIQQQSMPATTNSEPSHINVLDAYLYCTETAFAHKNASPALLKVAARNLLKLLTLQPSTYGPIFTARFRYILIRLMFHTGAGDEYAREQMAKLLAVLNLFATESQQTELISMLRSNLDPQSLSATDSIVHVSVCTLGNMIGVTKRYAPFAGADDADSFALRFNGIVEMIVTLFETTHKEVLQIACLAAIGEIARENALSFVDINTNSASDGDSNGDVAVDEQSKRSRMTISKQSIVAYLMEKMSSSQTASKVKERIITCLGMFTLGEYRESSIMNHMIDAVFRLNTEKNDEVQFTIGEFFSCVVGGNLHCSLFRQDEYTVLYQSEMFPEDTGMAEERRRTENQIRSELMTRILKRIIAQGVLSGKRIVRQSASIWLLAITKYCADSDALRGYLKDVQYAFSILLSDTNEVTQEVAGMGLACVYDIGDQQSKKDLVDSLMDSLSGRKKDKKDIKMSEDSDLLLFPEDMAEKSTSGGNVAGTSYKELVDVANDIGKPDMIYKLMAVSNQNAVWNTKRAAAFSAVNVASIAGDTTELEAILPQIVPKLYRYTYDPNALINRSMSSMWKALVKNTRETVNKYLDSIMKELVDGLKSSLWRVREASCNAVADIFTGRKFVDMERYLEDCFLGTFRIMDDVKETCRNAAVSSVKKLGAFGTKSCNPLYTESDAAKRALNIVVPLLLEKGIHFPLKEVVYFSLETIHKICQAAGVLITDHATNIIGTLLEHMSVIEPNVFNYLHLHQERYGFDTEQLEKIRVSIAQSGPIADTISLCTRQVSSEVSETLVPRLIDIVRSGVGITTRAATARVIMDLAKFQGKHVKKHAPKLLRSVMSAIENSRSPTERTQLASALPYLLQRTTISRAQKIVDQILDLYVKASEDDEDRRHAAGVIVLNLARQTKSTVRRFYESILPVAFLARYDQSKKVSEEWQTVWKESIDSSTKEVVRLFVTSISERAILCLDESTWLMKRQGARGILEIARELKNDLRPEMRRKLLQVLFGNVTGRVWDGKDLLLQAVGAVVASYGADNVKDEEDRGLLSKVLPIVSRETRRKASKLYKLEAYRCLHAVLQIQAMEAFVTVAYFEQTWKELTEELDLHWQSLRQMHHEQADAMDTSQDEGTSKAGYSASRGDATDFSKDRSHNIMDEHIISEVLLCIANLHPATVKEFDPQNALLHSCVQYFLRELSTEQLHTTRELQALVKGLQLLVKKSKVRTYRDMDTQISETIVANLKPTARHLQIREQVFTLLDKEWYGVVSNEKLTTDKRNRLISILVDGLKLHAQHEPSSSLKEYENVMIDRLNHYRQ